jgi:hypothetical protein
MGAWKTEQFSPHYVVYLNVSEYHLRFRQDGEEKSAISQCGS